MNSVLIVEDHNFQRAVLSRLLKKCGVNNVVEATNGAEALRILDSAPYPELIICDLEMPEMDGMEFIRYLGGKSIDTPVVISSAFDRALLGSVSKMAEAYGVHLLGVLEKPINIDQLNIILDSAGPSGTANNANYEQKVFSLSEIERGLKEGEFVPFFQPKVDLKTGAIVGAEALARWVHPEFGLITPGAFIGMLEKSGKIDLLTFPMLEQVARSVGRLISAGVSIKVSVNLSTTSLEDTTLADKITNVVNSAGVSPNNLVLEITESAAMTTLGPALENLTRLRIKGFGLSIDDYGTGYASLAQLARVPFTELKIDQGFVDGCSCSKTSKVIVQASIGLAHGLGLISVAEGVEQKDDLDQLQKMNCKIAQGYLISKPLSESMLLEFYRSNAGSVDLTQFS